MMRLEKRQRDPITGGYTPRSSSSATPSLVVVKEDEDAPPPGFNKKASRKKAVPASSSPLKKKATRSSSVTGPSSATTKKLAAVRKEKQPAAPAVTEKFSHCEAGDKSCCQFLCEGVNCAGGESPIPGQMVMHIRVSFIFVRNS